MPQIARQSFKPAANGKPSIRKVTSTDSILARAIPVGQLETDWFKFVLYGVNRVGKTTLACQWDKPLLLISFEPGEKSGGAKSVKKIAGVEYVNIGSGTQAIKLARELTSDTHYKTHVLDTVTSLQDIVLKELMHLAEVPVQLNWGLVTMDQYRERSEKTKEILRLYRDLKCNTNFVAQEKDHNPPESRKVLTRSIQVESFFAADLGGATVKWMHDSCDYIGRLYLDKETKLVKGQAAQLHGKTIPGEDRLEETGRIVRRLRTMLHPNYAAGFRSENPDAVPEYIEAVTPAEMYQKIMQVAKGIKVK